MNIANCIFKPLEFITGKIIGPPEIVVIETTNRCNLSCFMCYRLDWLNECGDMPLSLFKEIIKSLKHRPEQIWCHGGGEPLMYPDICEAIDYAYEKCRPKVLAISSNGTLLTRQMADNLAKTRLNWLNISIDGSDEDTYQRIRNTPLQPVIENIKYFKSISRIPVIINYTLMKNNIRSLLSLPELALSAGVDRINVQHIKLLGRQVKEERITDGPSEFRRIRNIVRRKAQDYKIPCRVPRFPHPIHICILPFRQIYFNFKGQIAPCCIAIHLSLEKNFADINGINIREWRKRVIRGDFPAECIKFCYIRNRRKIKWTEKI